MQWVVVHKKDPDKTGDFILAFNNKENLHIRGFLIHGPGFENRDLGLQETVSEPEVLSHMGDTAYEFIHALIEDKPNTPQPCLIEHVYLDYCERFTYVVFILTPIIVLSVVFRISYGWKAEKVIKSHRPGRFFKDSEIRMFTRKNIRFIVTTIETLLSMICVQAVSFLLFYFVCPWRSFSAETTLQRVMTVQLYVVYPITQGTETGIMFYLQTCYLRYRRNQKLVKDWHYYVMTASALAVSLSQIVFSLLEQKQHSAYFVGRMMYPIFQLSALVVCLIISTKAANTIDDDIFNKESELNERAKVLLHKTQKVVKASRALVIIHIVINIAVSIQIVIRSDEIKLLCYILLVVLQTLSVMAFAVLFFPSRWISHKQPKSAKSSVDPKFAIAASHELEDNNIVVESLSSLSLSSESDEND